MAKSETTDLISLLIVGGLIYYLYASGGLQQIVSGLKLPSIGGGSVTPGGPIKFSAAGDWGSGRNDNWEDVMTQMEKFKPNVVVSAGDQSYTDADDMKPVADRIKAMGAKFLGTEGNHDGGSGYEALYDSYSNSVIDIGNVSFMLLNTESSSSAASFAKSNFSKMKQKWKVVAFHKPIKTPKSDHGAANFGGLESEFEKAGIDIVLQAHNHLYARYEPENGVSYFLVGTGGESHYSGSGGGAAKINDEDFGTTNFTTSDSQITGEFVTTDGKVDDTFTITKSSTAKATRAYYTRIRPRRLR